MTPVTEPDVSAARRGAGSVEPPADSAGSAENPGTAGDAGELTNPVGAMAVAVLVGLGLVVCSRSSAVALLVGVAVLQALVVLAWVFGTSVPGRKGALVVAGAAAAAADVAVSVWPDDRLGPLLGVVGLAVPAMFVHQLMRGAARVRLLSSLGGTAVAVVAVAAAASLVQLRHEFDGSSLGGRVVAAVVAASAGALVVGQLVDLVMPAPRFDPAVDRGLLGVVASAGLGGSVGHLLLGGDAAFLDGRGAFVGAALGALAAFLAIGVAFVEHSTVLPGAAAARRLRPALGVVLPLCLLAPVAFLLCLAVRA